MIEECIEPNVCLLKTNLKNFRFTLLLFAMSFLDLDDQVNLHLVFCCSFFTIIFGHALPSVYSNLLNRLLTFFPLFLPSGYPASAKFSKHHFFIMHPRNYSCIFLTVNINFFVIPVSLKISSLFTCGIYGILSIRYNLISVAPWVFFIWEDCPALTAR